MYFLERQNYFGGVLLFGREDSFILRIKLFFVFFAPLVNLYYTPLFHKGGGGVSRFFSRRFFSLMLFFLGWFFFFFIVFFFCCVFYSTSFFWGEKNYKILSLFAHLLDYNVPRLCDRVYHDETTIRAMVLMCVANPNILSRLVL